MEITALVNKIFHRDDYTVEEVHAIYATNALASLAQALLGIFIPLYIFNLAKDNLLFSENIVSNGIIWILAFYFIGSASVLVNSIAGPKLLFKLSLKKSLFVSKLFLIATYAVLVLAERNVGFIFGAALLSGVHTVYYWIPYHIFFVKKADDGDKKYGTEVGKRDFLVGIASSMGPLLGALIISHFGFAFLYGLAIFLLLTATLPIILVVKENPHRKHEFKDVYLHFLINPKYAKTTIALGGNVLSGIIFVIFWTLMLYFGLQSFVEIGLLTTFSGIMSMALLVVVGKMIDTKGKKGIHLLGVGINTLLHLTRPFLRGTYALYANGVADNINSPAYNIPFNAAIYERSLEGSVSDFLVYREIALHGIRLIGLGLVGLGILLTNSWTWVFYVGAVASALTFLVN